MERPNCFCGTFGAASLQPSVRLAGGVVEGTILGVFSKENQRGNQQFGGTLFVCLTEFH